MIPRYINPEIAGIWSDKSKVYLWQEVELAVIEARTRLGLLPADVHGRITKILDENIFDFAWWKAREEEIRHDFQAFIDERVGHLPNDLQPHFHDGMTSFDTEEPAFSRMLISSCDYVHLALVRLETTLKSMAKRYRYTPMMGVTHGQAAEVQTFGKRCLGWYADISSDHDWLLEARKRVEFSKISGAIGNYGGVTPEIEEEALRILELKPYPGATQIVPREVHAPLAQALCQIVLTIDKISTAIRLGARTPRPIYQEPFGRKQKGSSRMPGKKNTIATEQMEGMARMALGYLNMIMLNIRTWEERAIEQSCVERVAWPDLFHVVVHSLSVISRVLEGLQVYPDNMMRDIIDTHGTWAAGPAKEFLREGLVPYDVNTDDAYRIVQLAAFIALQPREEIAHLRANPITGLQAAESLLESMEDIPPHDIISIQLIILGASLCVVPELDVSHEQVRHWNYALEMFFRNEENVGNWNRIFSLVDRLKDEDHLFRKLCG